MSRSMYVNRGESGGSGGNRVKRVLVAAGIVILLAVIGTLFIIQRQNAAADSVMDRFEAVMEEKDYAQVLSIHHDSQEKALTSRLSEHNRDLYAEAVKDMERVIFRRIGRIADSLYSSERPRLAKDDENFLLEMRELAASPLNEQVERTGLGVLSGEIPENRAEELLKEYAKIPLAEDEARLMIEELPELDSAKEPFLAAMNALDSQNYLGAAASLSAILDSGIISSDGKAASLIEAELKTVKQTMRPIMVQEIQDLVERSKYITADKRIREVLNQFPDDMEIIGLYEDIQKNVPKDLVQYTGLIEHITTRPLIVNTAVGFGPGPIAQTADSTMLSSYEFRKILEQLYQAGYVLIDLQTMMNENGELNPVFLPSGKKPLMLTLEGLNYYPARRQSGNAQNLVLDEDGNVAAQYVDETGAVQVSRTAEAVGILDQFIEVHPDFSFDGAKGTITLTGSMGVFGYVMNENQLAARNQQAARYSLPGEVYTAEQMTEMKTQAQAVIDRLKDTGWTFGSQTYYGAEMTALSAELVKADTELWFAEVGEMTGDVSILAYPNGAFLSGTDERKLYLQEQGFRYFLGMGPNPYQVFSPGYYFMDRLYLGGYALRNNLAGRLFDASLVYDPARTVPLA